MITLIILYICIIILYSYEKRIIETWGVKSIVNGMLKPVWNGIEKAAKGVTKGLKSCCIDPIIKEVEKIWKTMSALIKKLEKTIETAVKKVAGFVVEKVEAIGDIIKYIKDIMIGLKDLLIQAFELIRLITEKMTHMGQLIYLIIKKFEFCYKGGKRVYNKSLLKIQTLAVRINEIRKKIKTCVNFDVLSISNFGQYRQKFTEQFKSCLGVYEDSIGEIKQIVSEFRDILNDPYLFPQRSAIPLGKYDKGESVNFCKNGRKDLVLKKDFEKYNKLCNQCFNIDGIRGKGYKELVKLDRLISMSKIILTNTTSLFSDLNGLIKSFDKLF